MVSVESWMKAGIQWGFEEVGRLAAAAAAWISGQLFILCSIYEWLARVRREFREGESWFQTGGEIWITGSAVLPDESVMPFIVDLTSRSVLSFRSAKSSSIPMMN